MAGPVLCSSKRAQSTRPALFCSHGGGVKRNMRAAGINSQLRAARKDKRREGGEAFERLCGEFLFGEHCVPSRQRAQESSMHLRVRSACRQRMHATHARMPHATHATPACRIASSLLPPSSPPPPSVRWQVGRNQSCEFKSLISRISS